MSQKNQKELERYYYKVIESRKIRFQMVKRSIRNEYYAKSEDDLKKVLQDADFEDFSIGSYPRFYMLLQGWLYKLLQGWLNIQLPNKSKRYEFELLLTHLRTIVNSGVSLVEGLLGAARQTRSPRIRIALKLLAVDIARGIEPPEALSRQPTVFPDEIATAFTISDPGRYLDTYLKSLTLTQYRIDQIRRLLVYPLLLLVVFLVISPIVVLKILPTFRSIFQEIDVEPDFALHTLMTGLYSFFPTLLLIFYVGLLSIALLSRFSPLVLDQIIMKIPGYGRILKREKKASLLSIIAFKLQSGVALPTALQDAAFFIPFKSFKARLLRARTKIERGEAAEMVLSSALHPLFGVFLQLGDDLGAACELLAQVLREQADLCYERFRKIVIPLLVLAVGVLIGMFVIHSYWLIYGLTGYIIQIL